MSYWLILTITFVWLFAKILRIGRREASLPPGPPTIPLLGNLLLLPKTYPYLKFTEWAQQYGGILSLKLGSSNLVILTDVGAVKELMDRRSASTADRPPFYFGDLVTGGVHLVLARYASAINLRKAVHPILSPEASNRHIPIQTAETKQLLVDILRTPEAAYSHLARFSNSIIMSVTFGKRCPRYDTEHLKELFEMIHLWGTVVEIGAHPPVDLIPVLRYVPERWAPWKTLCRKVRSMQQKLYGGLLQECEARLRTGVENGCYMEDIIKRQDELGMDRQTVMYLGGVLLEAGSETTTSVLRTLLLALAEFPEAQRKAQEEMDRVVGDERSPTLEDIPHLPYIQALIKEAHRYRPTVPLGVSHASMKDEEVGSILACRRLSASPVHGGYNSERHHNCYQYLGIFHDPTLFDRPEMFNPDRYILTEYGTIPGVDDRYFRSNLIFGAGRRICPGLTLANNSLMLSVMHLVWAFDFSEAVHTTTGQPFSTDLVNYTEGITTCAIPFKCKIKPRNKFRTDIIEQQFIDAVDTFVKFENGLDQEERAWLAETRDKFVH